LGGSHGQLADAMAVARSTAQARVEALADKEPSEGERWARGLTDTADQEPKTRHTVTLDLDDEHAYFVLTEALRDFAAQQRGEADDTQARVEAGDVTEDYQRSELGDAQHR